MRNTNNFGVNLGTLRKKEHIKVLICYLLFTTKISIPKNDVIKILQENNLANYFEANASLSQLLDLKAIEQNGEKILLTESGEVIAKELESDVPFSIREKALAATIRLMAKSKIENENKVNIQKTKNGYETTLEISGGEFNLMSVTMYTPCLEQANFVKKNFHNDPEIFYKCFLSLSTKNKQGLKEILEDF